MTNGMDIKPQFQTELYDIMEEYSEDAIKKNIIYIDVSRKPTLLKVG